MSAWNQSLANASNGSTGKFRASLGGKWRLSRALFMRHKPAHPTTPGNRNRV